MNPPLPEWCRHRRLWFACLIAAWAPAALRAQSTPDPARKPDAVARRPAARLTPDLAPAYRLRGIAPALAWSANRPDRADGASPRGTGGCTFDNGAPLDDFGDPSSQLSDSTVPEWTFIGAAADDFLLGGPGETDLCRVTMIRAAFSFADDGIGNPSPTTTWESIFVTVYKDDGAGDPTSRPLLTPPGAQDGPYVVSQAVPASALQNETPAGGCRPCYIVDIPVNFMLKKGTPYWLSLVPVHDGAIHTTQSYWCISETPVGMSEMIAQQYFPLAGPPYDDWTEIPGNVDACDPDSPDAGSRRNLAFAIITATGAPDETGACCDDTIGGSMGTCLDDVSIADCQKENDRFSSGGTCDALDPPCGTTDPGACCMPTAVCEDALTPAQCAQAGGQWYMGDCFEVSCPPENEECDAFLPITGGSAAIPFNTAGAVVGTGEPLTNCGGIMQDIWFSYEVPCNGTVTVSTLGSSFDTVLAIYGPEEVCPPTCPPASPDGDYTELACSAETPAGLDSYLVLPASAGQCLLIRVGGKADAMPTGGVGILNVDCIESGMGACCHGNLTCEVLMEAECNASGDFFTPGQPCSALMTCPPPCCVGDLDADCVVDELDVPGFVDALLNPPAQGTVAFCRSDANRDYVINGLDVAPFIGRVMAMASCLASCCPGDTNGDGALDGLDVQGLVDALLSPPPCGSVAFCGADVNEDLAIDLDDADALIALLLAEAVCP